MILRDDRKKWQADSKDFCTILHGVSIGFGWHYCSHGLSRRANNRLNVLRPALLVRELQSLLPGNAIEKLWRHLKNCFRRTDPRLTWEQRLQLAYEECGPKYIEAIISSTIRWCRERHGDFEAGVLPPPAPVNGGVFVVDAKADEDDEVDEDDVQNALDALEEF